MGGEAWGLEDERAQNASIDIHENAIIMMKPIIGHGGYRMPTPLLGRLRLEDSKFKVSLGYRISSRPTQEIW